MKHAHVWVICSGLGLSLILGLVAPLEGFEQRDATRQTSVSELAPNGPCTPFVAPDLSYAQVELRLDSIDHQPSLGF